MTTNTGDIDDSAPPLDERHEVLTHLKSSALLCRNNTYRFCSVVVDLHCLRDRLLAISLRIQVDASIIDDRIDPIGMCFLQFSGQGLYRSEIGDIELSG